MASLKLVNVNKTFLNSKKPVLKDISFEALKGEFIVLVGPSGCGKSTLLRIIAGLESPDSGSIFIGPTDVTQIHPSKRDIAMVFQDYALYPHMTVEQNLSFGLKMQKAPNISEQVSTIADMLDLSELMDRRPSELSGGQRQRVAIGRAIVRKPAVFLFDEPLSNLDAKLRSQTRIELASLHKKIGNTAVYVTHDQAEAMTMADRIIVLHQGVIQQSGTPLELYHHPVNTFVATFIGNPSMNLLHGEVRAQQKNSIFRYRNSEITLPICLDMPQNIWTPVTLGLRPEALKALTAEGRESQGNIDILLHVELLEKHGHETHLIGSWNDTQLILRSANPNRLAIMHRAERGQQIKVTIDVTATHWFQKDGFRITEKPAHL